MILEGFVGAFGTGLVVWGILRGIENPKKLVFVPIGLALLILLHFYLKRTKGKGLSKGWLSRRPRRK